MSNTPKSLDDMTEVELKKLLKDMAERIKYFLPPNTGFVLIATPFDPEEGKQRTGVAQYVSNVERLCAAKWMEETIARWRTNDGVIPRVGP